MNQNFVSFATDYYLCYLKRTPMKLSQYQPKPFEKPQFLGNYLDCLKQEKIKIYYYPTLPENLARVEQLLRPPGNPQDR